MEDEHVSMAAVAVATALQQDTEERWKRGRLHKGRRSGVPSSLVWVSVPLSGSVSSSAPGSLKGLSLREVGRRDEGGERSRAVSYERPFRTKRGEARTHFLQLAASQTEKILWTGFISSHKALGSKQLVECFLTL